MTVTTCYLYIIYRNFHVSPPEKQKSRVPPARRANSWSTDGISLEIRLLCLHGTGKHWKWCENGYKLVNWVENKIKHTIITVNKVSRSVGRTLQYRELLNYPTRISLFLDFPLFLQKLAQWSTIGQLSNPNNWIKYNNWT